MELISEKPGTDAYSDVEELACAFDIEKYVQREKERYPADWSVCFWCRSALVQGRMAGVVKEAVHLFR